MRLQTLIVALATKALVRASTLYNGAQRIALSPDMTASCYAAFNTELNCPKNILQILPYAYTDVGWNTSMLTSMCTEECSSSLSVLKLAVAAGCLSQSFNFNSAEMTFVDIVDLIQYKHGLVCLSDVSSGVFCLDVEDSWNITTLNRTGNATWPAHTYKEYPDLRTDSWEIPTDEDGVYIEPFNSNIFQAAASIKSDGETKAADYWTEVFDPIEDSNYGWPYSLEYDEYPLEIQCSSCWIQRYKYGYVSKWGSIWDETTKQVWDNMQMNCNINETFIPVNDYCGRNWDGPDSWVPREYPPPKCYQNLTIDAERMSCSRIGLDHSVATSALRALNPGISCVSVSNSVLCAPRSCPVTMVTENIPFSLFWKRMNYNNITETQFRSWNRFLSISLMYAGDTVCVGPPSRSFA